MCIFTGINLLQFQKTKKSRNLKQRICFSRERRLDRQCRMKVSCSLRLYWQNSIFIIQFYFISRFVNLRIIHFTLAFFSFFSILRSSFPILFNYYQYIALMEPGTSHQFPNQYSPSSYAYPHPTLYMVQYQNLQDDLRPNYLKPSDYERWYNYQIQIYYQQAFYQQYQPVGQSPVKKEKVSRNQKRKAKKKALEEQYKREKDKIGKWVNLERKDLVEGLQKIEQQETKIRERKKEKLSFLIEIHKQIYKHMVKKNRGKIQQRKKDIGNFRKKKKRPSHIKRMKKLYQQLNNFGRPSGSANKISQIKKQKHQAEDCEDNDQDYVTQSDSDDQGVLVQKESKKNGRQIAIESRQQKQQTRRKAFQQKQQQKKNAKVEDLDQKEIKTIEYKRIGKLTGSKYNGITLRQWVDHCPSQKLEEIVLRFINRLAYKQAIKKVNHPEKARKIIIAGLHQCRRTLWTTIEKKKCRLLIVALNIEKNNFQRGTDDQLQQVLDYAYKENVAIIHTSTRSKLGRAFTGKFGPRISVISVVNFEGYEDMFEVIIQQWKSLKKIYESNQYVLNF